MKEQKEDGNFLLIYALKMPIDIHRYCHSRVAQTVSRPQPKLKLHFTVVFQVVAELSRNFNIPRRERLKIQPLLVIPSPRFTRLPSSSSRSISRSLLLSSSIPLAFSTPLRAYVGGFDGKSFVETLSARVPFAYF